MASRSIRCQEDVPSVAIMTAPSYGKRAGRGPGSAAGLPAPSPRSDPRPEGFVEGHYVQRTWFESIAERELRRRRLTEDGNALITGRDLREGSPAAPLLIETWQ